MIAAAVVLLGGYFCWQQNALEVNRTERSFARQLRAEVAPFPPERIAMYPQSSGNLLFYLDKERPVEIVRSPGEFRGFIEQGCAGVVITRQEYAERLPVEITSRLLKQRIVREQVRPWESKSSKRGKWVAWLWEDFSAIAAPVEATKGADDAE
jgi:hypothetical protein